MSLILDAGALIAVERGDRELDVLLKRELLASRIPATHGGVIGQVWRGGSGQARLARLLPGITVEPLTGALGQRAGALLARARRRDVIDAALVLLATISFRWPRQPGSMSTSSRFDRSGDGVSARTRARS